MSIYYLGGFPPEYGGVTIKNENLYLALSQRIKIKRVDLNRVKEKNISETIRLIMALINPFNRFVVGVAGKNTRKRFVKLMYLFNRCAIKKSIIMLMGGSSVDDILEDVQYFKYISKFKMIYVETRGMCNKLNSNGMSNVELYPNARFRPVKNYYREDETQNKLKCVYFSLISVDKGIDLVLEVAKQKKDLSIAVYGEISENYRDIFEKEVASLHNLQYRGVFKGTNEDTYAELSKYDVLLFPTRWKSEGVPGIIVESKIAGIALIVSNQNYNAELVCDGVEGIILSENTADALCNAIERFENDRKFLANVKKESNRSAECYYIENYISDISRLLLGSSFKE